MSRDVTRYAPALDADAARLAETCGQEQLAFLYAQPAADLVEGIGQPHIEGSISVEFGDWPKSVRDLATQLGALVATKPK